MLRGCIDGARLFDGSISLEALARINEALDVQDHNERVLMEKEQAKARAESKPVARR